MARTICLCGEKSDAATRCHYRGDGVHVKAQCSGTGHERCSNYAIRIYVRPARDSYGQLVLWNCGRCVRAF